MLFQDGIGLDISDQQVAVVYLKSSMKGPELIAHEVIPLDPRKTFRDQLETTAHQLKAFIDAHRLNGCGTFLGIPQEKLLLREISLPLAAKENLTETIRYELDRYMPIPGEDIYIDSQIAGEDRKSNRLAVTLIAAKKSEVSAFIELANHCGLGLSGIEPSSAGALHLLTRIDGLLTTSEFVLAAMGSTQWYLTAGSDGRLRSVRTLPAPPSNGSDPGPVDAALKTFDKRRDNKDGDQVIVFFGPGMNDGLMAAIEDAAANRRCRRLALEELPVPDWDLINAYGLALKAFHEPKTRINLLPKSLRKKPSRIGQWMLVVLSTAAVLTGLGWLGSHILQQRFMSHRLEANIRELDAQMIEIKQMESNAEALKARISFLEGIKQDGVPILDLLRELSTTIPPTAWIRELNVSGNEIRLDGYADSASELIPVLDASPMITDVTFLSAITRGRDGKEKFRIGFTLAQSSR